MKRNLALIAAAGAGAAALAAVVARRRRRAEPGAPPDADPRAEDLRRKLAEARETAADEEDFEAAGMAGETIVEDEGTSTQAPPPDDLELDRRRVHEEARATAEEMRRTPEDHS